MKLIPLTQGKFAMVDDDVYEWASRFEWYARKSGRTFYAARKLRLPNGKQTTRQLHREILKAAPGVFVDHIDGDGLNDLKGNMRLCSQSENNQNSYKHRDNTSGYKGVWIYRRSGKWGASITVAGAQKYLGSFDTPLQAAHAYDRAARQYYGEFARPNLPP